MKAAALLAPLLMAATAAAPLPPEKPPGVEAPASPATPQGAETLPPYQPEVERLATLMGTLAFMRDLCGATDAAQWRTRMEDLLAAEGSTPTRRDRLAGAFNAGLRGYAATYRRCTPAAALVIDRALSEVGHLTQDLANRFGG
ncbi:TIGR02301 family protein [Lichenihabitans sp. Uapishka_5]|uniref:TIGR02301 family protein n=1 Tax=Lichenihabitans sp. Uapishka_5 TaxID=3037302 RepID=UPI0029E7DBA0|nr:TIGR02301 family protein [Lichenihabitans sp. Uapishka_5]MDX7951890.1 TIGR02301 family protein [Lichenihabitans sp. Uapishka_5]